MKVPTYGPAPTVAPLGGSLPYQTIQAPPDAFGAPQARAGSFIAERLERVAANEGRAVQGLGGGIMQVGDALGKEADRQAMLRNEAAVKDLYANQFSTTINGLLYDPKTGFYAKQGRDAVDAQDSTVKALQQARQDTLAGLSNPEQQRMFNDVSLHRLQMEQEGVSRHALQQNTAYQDQMSAATTQTHISDAINNYADPVKYDIFVGNAVNETINHMAERGASPEAIRAATRDLYSKAFLGKVEKLSATGNPQAALDALRSEEGRKTLSGPIALELDKQLQATATAVAGEDWVKTRTGGTPVPPGMATQLGVSTAEVQRALVGAARAAGVDPNHAATVAAIESDTGRSLGRIGNLGQVKGGSTDPKDLAGQTRDLVAEWQRVGPIADKAAGGSAQPWQRYVVYQQGEGGGPALLTAQRTAKVSEALGGFYKDGGAAAVAGNGGDPNGTVGQFLDFLKSKWEHTAARAALDPAAATAAPPPPAALPAPAVSPRGQLLEFQKVYPGLQAEAAAEPNLLARDAKLKALDKLLGEKTKASAAYSAQTSDLLMKTGLDPKFTSIAQLTPDQVAAASDNPHMMSWLENRAKANASGGESIDWTPQRYQEAARLRGIILGDDPKAREELRASLYQWADPKARGELVLPQAELLHDMALFDGIERKTQAAMDRGASLTAALNALKKSDDLKPFYDARGHQTDGMVKAYQTFSGSLEQSLSQAMIEKKRSLTEDEMRTVGRSLLANGSVPGTLWSHDRRRFVALSEGSDGQWTVPYDKVPPDQRQMLQERARRNIGRALTPEEISATYSQMMERRSGGHLDQ